MFNSLDEAKALRDKIIAYNEPTAIYEIEHFKLASICEDYISAQQCCEGMGSEIKSLRNYIRLLEKENKELKGKVEDER